MNGSGINLSTSASHPQMQKCPPKHPQVTYMHMPHRKYKERRGGERRKKEREGEGDKGRALAAKPDYMSLIPGPTWYKEKTDSHRLASDLCAMCAYIHAQN